MYKEPGEVVGISQMDGKYFGVESPLLTMEVCGEDGSTQRSILSGGYLCFQREPESNPGAWVITRIPKGLNKLTVGEKRKFTSNGGNPIFGDGEVTVGAVTVDVHGIPRNVPFSSYGPSPLVEAREIFEQCLRIQMQREEAKMQREEAEVAFKGPIPHITDEWFR